MMIYRTIGALIGNQEPLTMPATATVLDAAQGMAERHVGAVPVMDGERLIGLFTERDLLNRVVAAGKDPVSLTLEQVMTRDPLTIGAHQPLADALDIMFARKFRHLPVLNEAGTLIGVVSFRDVPAIYQVLRERWLAAHEGMETAA